MDDYPGVRQGPATETSDPRDRRLSPRYPVKGAVQLIEQNGNLRKIGMLKDISLEGCFVHSSVELALQKQVRLRFSIGADFDMEGVVRRIDTGRGVGVQFKDVPK